MNSFQVLERTQNIHQNYLLEASAGTGKTFSIENIVIRLLIEGDPISLDQILIVTFTNAATRDLKNRVHKNIVKSIHILKEARKCLQRDIKISDYLSNIIEKGEGEIQRALRNLEQALCAFDFAQIFTIHSFCARMLSENSLEANFNISSDEDGEVASAQMLRTALRDLFRGGGLDQKFTQAHLNLLLKEFRGDLEKLENELLGTVQRGIEIEAQPSLEEILARFNAAMHALKAKHKLTSENILSDCLKRAPYYNKINSEGVLKPEVFEKIKKFAQLFDKEQWDREDLDLLVEDGLHIVEIFDESRKSKKKINSNPEVHYPFLTEILKSHLQKFVNVNHVFSRLAFEFQFVLKKCKENDEFFSHDDYLKRMCDALRDVHFKANVQAKYKAAIIDEFQDTDPLQWEIFQKLFLDTPSSKSLLYLVGDPKQSIYAFRQADIYTYLHAAKQIGTESHFSLDTNYRSQPSLVNALNKLFCEASCPGLLSFPKFDSSLRYPEVKSSPAITPKQFSDSKGAVHFFVAEEREGNSNLEVIEREFLFTFIVQEIQQLSAKDQFFYQQFAILVADRYQAARLSEFLREWDIPSSLQKAASLANSPATPAMKELLAAILNPKDQNALKIALGGKIIRWNQQEVKTLDSSEALEKVLYKFYALREELIEEGISSFFYKFLQTAWKEDELTVFERFLREEDSEEFLEDLLQVSDLLLDYENTYRRGPEGLIQYLDQLKTLMDSEGENIKKISDPAKNAVQIMTIHASKGLEFDIVFTLGLAKRHKSDALMIPVERGNRRCLIPVDDKNMQEYQIYCRELDAEKLRQFYVAMTRAKYRVYNPIYCTASKVKLGEASPMDLFLARLGQAPMEDWKKIYQRIQDFDIQSFKKFIRALPPEASISYTLLRETPSFLERCPKKETVELCKPPQVVIPGRESFIHSFSTLASSLKSSGKNPLMEAPRDFHASLKSPHTLPIGAETGTLLHQCFEKLDFENYKMIASAEELLNLVSPLVYGTEYEPWKHVLCQMIFNALKVPFNGEFTLCDVSSQHCLRESEFFYQSFIKKSPGFLKGFIDLFFEHNGKYYLLDWKTNWLGPDCVHYHRDSMKSSMEENSYFLQARLYFEAIKKYLRIVDGRPFEQIFGGIFYIFIRGLQIEETNHYGIYNFTFSSDGKEARMPTCLQLDLFSKE